ncbi:TPR-like protein [Punctularia strigosozonata HHB-11173 SS5]|uniref:Tetratricopeptide repeat protein 29 n=1 Tax=Punctularia strigosozonata (strain HHB-11173) TaxID=741275 RepID=R7S296_PUNST|nr:TPR-like protein [Punctularia strigosozonata HHB-11173 SS5]EIN03984.1 TPR-like protein [Punctularia strigosozonata HHB-11173 SS5]
MASHPQPAVDPSKEPEVADYQKRLDRALANGETLLSVVEALTEGVVVCDPLKGSVKLAKELIKMVQKVRKNRDDCDELARRVFKLTGTMLGILDGKRDEDVPPELKTCLDSVHATLKKIKDGLEPLRLSKRFSFRAWIRALLRREYVADRITSYNAQIDQCLQEFTVVVVGQVSLGLMTLNSAVGVVYSRLDDVYSKARDVSTGVKNVHSDVKSVRSDVTDIYTAVIRIESLIHKHLEGTSSGTQANASIDVSLQFVPAPPRLYGRDATVKDVVGKLCDAEQYHIAILGVGGIGKTSVALGVADDSVIKAQNNCYFIRCDTLGTETSLVNAVLHAVDRTSSVHGDPMEHLKTRLEKSIRPVILILDNFESSWDSDTPYIRQKLTEVLRTLAAIPKVQLIVTMRGDSPPAEADVQWSPVRLDPLGHIPARELFLSIKPETPPNEYRDLDLLLEKCDGLPLAVKLLAQLKPSSTCGRLLQRWDKRKSALLQTDHLSPSRETSLRVSISMSLESAPMRLIPEAIPLLAVLCQLPDGIPGGVKQLEEMDLGFEDVDVALATVLGSGLAFKAADDSLRVLSPIREHIIDHDVTVPQRPLLPHRQYEALLRYYVRLVETHARSNPGDDAYKPAYEALLPEIGNIIYLFKQELVRGGDKVSGVARAAYSFARFQINLRPSTELIDLLLDHWDLYEIRKARGDALAVRGGILMQADRYTSAMEDYVAACEDYKNSGDMLHLASALKGIGDVYYMQSRHDDAMAAYNRAYNVCSVIGDKQGMADCLKGWADVHRMKNELPQAIMKLTWAHHLYSNIGNRRGVTNCLETLGDVHRMQGEYPQAIKKLTRAHDLYSEMGNRQGVANCLHSLGVVHRMQNDYPQAIEKLIRAHDVYSEIGSRQGVANCLHSLGEVHRMQNDYPQAIEKLTRAHDVFSEIGERLGMASCLRSLGEVHRMQGEYPQAIEKLTQAHDVSSEIGDRNGVANCLRSLADIHCEQNEYPQAIEELTRAHDLYSEIGDQDGAADALHRLGDIDRIQGRYDQAVEKLGRALDLASSAGNQLRMALYHIYIGLLNHDQNRDADANEHFTTARTLFTEIQHQTNAQYSPRLIAAIRESMVVAEAESSSATGSVANNDETGGI